MRLLVLLSRFPHPLDKGDKVRAFFQIRELSKRHRIVLCALTHEDIPPTSLEALAPFCERIEVFRLSMAETVGGLTSAALSGAPLQTGLSYSVRVHELLERVVSQTRPDRALFQLVRTAPYAQGLDLEITLDYMDALSWSTRNVAAHEGGPIGALRAQEAGRLLRYETEVLDRFEKCCIITGQDRGRLATPRRGEVAIVPNGVDLDLFQPREISPECDLLFVGNLSYPPNVAAARSLALDILPRVRKVRPRTTLKLAGTEPRASVTRLRAEGVEVTGWVDDIAACYASAMIFVAPLSLGAGVPNKVLQALAMGVPTVAAPEVSIALDTNPDVMMVGANAQETAERVLELLGDPARAARLGRAGRAFVESHLRWDQAVRSLEELLEGPPARKLSRKILS